MDKNLYNIHAINETGTKFCERGYDTTNTLALDELSDKELKVTYDNIINDNKNLEEQLKAKEKSPTKTDRYSVFAVKERLRNNEDYLKAIKDEVANREYNKKVKNLVNKKAQENAEVGQMLPQTPVSGPILRKEF